MDDLLSPQLLVTLGAISVAAGVLGTVATGWVLVRLPADYFVDRERHTTPMNPALRVGKNLLGVCAVVLGALMAVPGVPGPGLVAVLLGITLLDFPGKYAAERWLVRRPLVHGAIDRLRVRFGREPLRL